MLLIPIFTMFVCSALILVLYWHLLRRYKKALHALSAILKAVGSLPNSAYGPKRNHEQLLNAQLYLAEAAMPGLDMDEKIANERWDELDKSMQYIAEKSKLCCEAIESYHDDVDPRSKKNHSKP